MAPVIHPDPDLLATLARQLATEDDVDAVLTRVVDAAVAQIDGAGHAGITVISRRSVSTPVCTDDLVRQVDRHQYDTREGPCMTAAFEHEQVVRVNDLHADDRWPDFVAAIHELPVRSMLSFRLYTGTDADADDTFGALNVYAAEPEAFDDESVHTGALLAAHAAVAATSAEKTANLRVALESRDCIGQAKGILMERYKLSADQAFDLLIAASQHTRRKLRDVAEVLSTTGELVAD